MKERLNLNSTLSRNVVLSDLWSVFDSSVTFRSKFFRVLVCCCLCLGVVEDALFCKLSNVTVVDTFAVWILESEVDD
jgi:hypothetical protein